VANGISVGVKCNVIPIRWRQYSGKWQINSRLQHILDEHDCLFCNMLVAAIWIQISAVSHCSINIQIIRYFSNHVPDNDHSMQSATDVSRGLAGYVC